MLPRVILHNTISLDGALSGFPVDMDQHYGIATQFLAQAFLVGADTVLQAEVELPPETEMDFQPPGGRANTLPWWVITDSRGRLAGKLHFFRRMPYIRDIIVLTSKATPAHYLEYLKKRRYPVIREGMDRVDLPAVFRVLQAEYGVHFILSDTGAKLSNVLLQKGLIHEISLLIAPVLKGSSPVKLFGNLRLPELQKLELMEHRILEGGYFWLHYSLKKS